MKHAGYTNISQPKQNKKPNEVANGQWSYRVRPARQQRPSGLIRVGITALGAIEVAD